MISAQDVIQRTRRQLTLGALLRWALIATALLAMVAQPLLDQAGITGLGVLFAVAAIWIALSFRSARYSRLAADSSSLIATGQFDQAEQNLDEALGSFSMFRTVKLMGLHRLAMLRHAQNRWQDSALLARAVLMQRLAPASGLDRSTRLILAESLLELGDLPGAFDSLSRLYSQRLSLREALNLLAVQLDYESRVGAWEAMFAQIKRKTELAELLPATQSARTQALLGLAAKKLGRRDWAEWLRARVELLCDVQVLCASRPLLWELWRAE